MEVLKIFTDRLKDGEVEKIKLDIPSDFLEVHEPDCDFSHPVQIQGEAYLANTHLIIQLQVATNAMIPCRICNQQQQVAVSVLFDHAAELSELETPDFDYSQELREMLLLQVPQFVECPDCPERGVVNKYLKQPEAGHFPFSGL